MIKFLGLSYHPKEVIGGGAFLLINLTEMCEWSPKSNLKNTKINASVTLHAASDALMEVALLSNLLKNTYVNEAVQF